MLIVVSLADVLQNNLPAIRQVVILSNDEHLKRPANRTTFVTDKV